ncbi:SDR family oxidoreductase, partial [Streptomyces sp. NPDC059389]|uniref:SDR family oxidoreductase n=1 Tax=Streptomyces sp. NPDC059389 TaxID=3346818 RepID=UPI0036BB517E
TLKTNGHTAMGAPGRPAWSVLGIPLGRAGRPRGFAGAVAWLLSPDASYTTGAVLRVSGGR